jgi:lipopolysaccharide transport protein LptA/LPS export ABC transporter protein LptC
MAMRQGNLTVGRIRVLRWLLLAVALALVAGLASLYYAGRAAQPGLVADDGPGVTDESVQQLGRGFDHTVSHEGRQLLRIRGNRDRRDRDGNLQVEEVLITAFQQDGTRYEVAADVATYNLEKREAVLEGNVSLAGPDGFTLRSGALTLREGGQWVESLTPVTFQYGTKNPLTGKAKGLQAFIDRGNFMLSDDVQMSAAQVEGEPPFNLSAQRVVFQRSLHLLRAEGGVILKWGRSHLRSQRIAAHLAPEDNRLQFVRARWHVKAVLHDEDEAGRDRHLLAEGSSLALLMDDRGRAPVKLELERGGGEQAHLRRGVPAASEFFDLLAFHVEAQLVDGRVSTTNATGDVTLVIQQAGAPRRQLSAGRASGVFTAAGELAHLEVHEDVRLAEGPRKLTGDRAVVTPQRTEVYGTPVVLLSERGELRAPQITYTAEASLAHASGGIEATMAPGDDNPLRQTPMATGEGPIRVEAAEAFWRDQPRSFLFRGKVRAWSGERVLRAEQLRGEPDAQLLTAAGGVETVWFMPAPAQGGSPQQVRVNAGMLSYSDRDDLLIYEEGVRVVDGQRTLSSNRLQVELDEKGEAQRMIATGEVRLDAPSEGRTITAQRAEYDLAGERVVFHGSPVTLQDRKGGTLNGAQAVYSTADGKVRVTASEEPIAAASPGGNA